MSESDDALITALKYVQEFDPSKLSRREELGLSFAFDEVVGSARKAVDFYKQIPWQQLNEVPPNYQTAIKSSVDSFASLISEIFNFDPQAIDNPRDVRQNIISRMTDAYNQAFNSLCPIVSYLAARNKDYSAIEREARAAVDGVAKDAASFKSQMLDAEAETKRILNQIRQAAAEEGVMQQAGYFKEEADLHDTKGDVWQRYTIATAVGLGIFAALTVFLPKVPFLKPTTPYEAVQLGISKILVFAVIAYMLFMCARNLSAHRHNAVVNRHRQNALLTFNALADAATGEDRRDIVLTHAAGCIFAPQETGYTRAQVGSGPSATQLIEVLPKIAGSAHG
jgi:hypothetical protein